VSGNPEERRQGDDQIITARSCMLSPGSSSAYRPACRRRPPASSLQPLCGRCWRSFGRPGDGPSERKIRTQADLIPFTSGGPSFPSPSSRKNRPLDDRPPAGSRPAGGDLRREGPAQQRGTQSKEDFRFKENLFRRENLCFKENSFCKENLFREDLRFWKDLQRSWGGSPTQLPPVLL
jgi:hypothetical protein